MRTKMLCLSLIVLVAAVARVQAEEPSAATLRAKTIAPFIDELTVAVARVDISQLKLGPIFDEACELVPDRAQEILTAQMTADMIREMFVSAGGKDVYAVVSLADVPREPLLVVVPLYEKTNEAMVKSMLMQAQLPVVERCGDVLIAGRKEVVERVKAIEPDCRPEMAAAFEAAGDTTIQLLVLPPKHTQRVVEEILPELPEAIGGGCHYFADSRFSVGCRRTEWSAETHRASGCSVGRQAIRREGPGKVGRCGEGRCQG